MQLRPVLDWTDTADPLPAAGGLDDVERILGDGQVVVLSGAGLSTDSGIPDYRGENGSLRRHTPMTYQDFTGSQAGRRRYWARSFVGWRAMTRAAPNVGHHAVAALGDAGYLSAVITQNVDGLHHAAGSHETVELHGSLDRVLCLDCRETSSRAALDRRLRAANPDFRDVTAEINPDGDVELDERLVGGFKVVDCDACGDGVLKPDVVFFGENVPKPRVQQCYDHIDEARALLVLGSSLTVMSGLRFVRYAAKQGKPVAIVNQGRTRGDVHAGVRLDTRLGPALTELADRLGCTPAGAAV